MISLKDISKTFDFNSTPILKNIHLEIPKGEIIGVIGKTGAGKSTLLRTINLLERPTSGQVIIDGVDLTSLSSRALQQQRRYIGMIFQHFNLLASKTAYDNVVMPLKFSKINSIEARKKAIAMLERVGLGDKAHAYPHQLSGGQKQRVAIARALITQPKILLCDEATSALDPQTSRSILELLKDLHNDMQLTLVMVTHQMEVVKTICERIIVMESGEIVEIAQTQAFFLRPQTDMGQALVETALRENLPTQVIIPWDLTSNQHQILVRIFFDNETVNKPIISEMIQLFEVRLNILQANIEHIRGDAIGIMIVLISGKQENIQSALNYLKDSNMVHEVMQEKP